ncbi:MAG: hypothetical protein JNK72_15860 [Myxococcales bacterium]|nr:hypothetical protein [Myxococcales bacterium]
MNEQYNRGEVWQLVLSGAPPDEPGARWSIRAVVDTHLAETFIEVPVRFQSHFDDYGTEADSRHGPFIARVAAALGITVGQRYPGRYDLAQASLRPMLDGLAAALIDPVESSASASLSGDLDGARVFVNIVRGRWPEAPYAKVLKPDARLRSLMAEACAAVGAPTAPSHDANEVASYGPVEDASLGPFCAFLLARLGG